MMFEYLQLFSSIMLHPKSVIEYSIIRPYFFNSSIWLGNLKEKERPIDLRQSGRNIGKVIGDLPPVIDTQKSSGC
jgi:hypothetical protein